MDAYSEADECGNSKSGRSKRKGARQGAGTNCTHKNYEKSGWPALKERNRERLRQNFDPKADAGVRRLRQRPSWPVSRDHG